MHKIFSCCVTLSQKCPSLSGENGPIPGFPPLAAEPPPKCLASWDLGQKNCQQQESNVETNLLLLNLAKLLPGLEIASKFCPSPGFPPIAAEPLSKCLASWDISQKTGAAR